MDKKEIMNNAIVQSYNSYHATMGDLKSAQDLKDIPPREALAFLNVIAHVARVVFEIARIHKAEDKAKKEQQPNA